MESRNFGECNSLRDGERLVERVRHLATESLGEEEREHARHERHSPEDDGGERLPHAELRDDRTSSS